MYQVLCLALSKPPNLKVPAIGEHVICGIQMHSNIGGLSVMSRELVGQSYGNQMYEILFTERRLGECYLTVFPQAFRTVGSGAEEHSGEK